MELAVTGRAKIDKVFFFVESTKIGRFIAATMLGLGLKTRGANDCGTSTLASVVSARVGSGSVILAQYCKETFGGDILGVSRCAFPAKSIGPLDIACSRTTKEGDKRADDEKLLIGSSPIMPVF